MRGRRYEMWGGNNGVKGEVWLDIYTDQGNYLAECKFLDDNRLNVCWTSHVLEPPAPVLLELSALPLHTVETEEPIKAQCGELLAKWIRQDVLTVLYNSVSKALETGDLGGLYWKYFTLQWLDGLGKELGQVLSPERVAAVKAKIDEMREKAKALGLASDKGTGAKRPATSKMSKEEKEEFRAWQKAKQVQA